MQSATPAASIDSMPLGATQARTLGAAELTVSHDVDTYLDSLPGMEFDAVRTGRGHGPTVVLTTGSDDFVAVSAVARFPVAGRTTMPDGIVTAACVTSAPAGSRWCGIDLQPGTVVVWGPGAEHTGQDPAGLAYTFMATSRARLGESADQLGLELRPPAHGHVHSLPASEQTRALGYTLSSLVGAAAAGVAPPFNREDDALHALTAALSEERRTRRVGGGKGLDSRTIAHTCIEYAMAVDRIVSTRELCLVAHVSERRLRAAFVDTYGRGPVGFFRLWALDQARRRLVGADPASETVTRIAVDLGFSHFGRFAGRYRELYGEAPSATLASVPSV